MITYLDALVRLYAIQFWRRLGLAKDGKVYGAGFLRNRNWRAYLEAENRKVSFRLKDRAACIRCSQKLAEDSTGDHIIPIKDGGPEGAQNYLPLCQPCNASKGARDLLDWWLASGRQATELSDDLLCAYTRLKYRWCETKGYSYATAPPFLERALESFRQVLPVSHWGQVSLLCPELTYLDWDRMLFALRNNIRNGKMDEAQAWKIVENYGHLHFPDLTA